MAVQIVSDLHLEAPKAYNEFDIVPKAPILALLGDIGNVAAHKVDFLAFLTRQLKRFRVILYVAGNHEAYNSTWPKTLGILRAFERDVRARRRDASSSSTTGQAAEGDFFLLKRGIFRAPDSNLVVLGCSLFSHVPPQSELAVGAGLNDFSQIWDWDVEAHNEAHDRDVAWLNEQVAELEGSGDVSIIILSHWSPSRDERASDPRHSRSPITSGFATDLSGEVCFRSSKVKVWAFGHTHYNCDFTVERGGGAEPLRLLTNQRGYYFSQAAGYDGEKTVEV